MAGCRPLSVPMPPSPYLRLSLGPMMVSGFEAHEVKAYVQMSRVTQVHLHCLGPQRRGVQESQPNPGAAPPPNHGPCSGAVVVAPLMITVFGIPEHDKRLSTHSPSLLRRLFVQ